MLLTVASTDETIKSVQLRDYEIKSRQVVADGQKWDDR